MINKLIQMAARSAALAVVVVMALLSAASAQEPAPKDVSGQPVLSQAVSLPEAVDIALKNNPSIEARRALVAAAAARIGMARAMTRPQLSTTTYASIGNMPMVLPGSPGVEPQNYSLTGDVPRLDQNLMLMFPLYTGGGLTGKVASAEAAREASVYDVATSELDTALAVKQAYYMAQLAQRYVAAYQRRVDEATERLRIAQESFDVGRIAKYDLLRNQTDLAEAKQQLNNSQRDVELAQVDLKNMMGVSQTSQLTLSQDLVSQPAPAPLDELQSIALKQRPEIQAFQARIRGAEATVRVAKSAYAPQVYATAMADFIRSKGNEEEDGDETGYLIGLTATFPIMDGGLRKSSVDEAEAMLNAMKADKQMTINDIAKSVASAYAQFGAAAKNADLSLAAVAQAEEDYRVIRMRYEAGRATNVEVLDALASLTRAQTMHAEALYEQNISRDTLTRATGQK